jgi:hypothetical protein
MCDKHERHLEKVEKKLLEREKIRLQQYQFETLVMYDCWEEGGEDQVRRQLSTRGI